MKNFLAIPVSDQHSGLRLDQVVADHLQGRGVARARVQAWIRAGLVRIDGQVCSRTARRLAGKEMVQVVIPNQLSELKPEDGSLDIVYQDEALAVLNKPAGLVVHPAPGLHEGTLVHQMLHRFPELQKLEGLRPGIVHRLDKDTTGLVAVALNESARLKMTESFAIRQVEKSYLALVHGLPDRSCGTIDAPIGRHPVLKTRMAVVLKGGREAVSDYALLWADPKARFSLLQVGIRTGRTHQIRVHMRHAGHPLLGDQVYSSPEARHAVRNLPWGPRLINRPMLHSWRLSLPHPQTGNRIHFHIPPPRDFLRTMLVCSRQVQKVGLTGLPGSGKSVLLEALAATGLPVWNADAAIRYLYKPGQDGWELLRRRFGQRFMVEETGSVNTVALLAAMRESPALRKEIEAMIHPLAMHSLEAFWTEHSSGRAALAEVPLLLESGWQGGFDVLVGLFCADGQRGQWLRSSRGWDEEVQADVESWQWPGPDKLRACGLVVANPGTLAGMQLRADALGRTLRWLRRHKARSHYFRIRDIVA